MDLFAQTVVRAQERWLALFADPPRAIDLYHGDPLVPPHPCVRQVLRETADATVCWDPDDPGTDLPLKNPEAGPRLTLHPYRSPRLCAEFLVEAATVRFRANGIPVSTTESEITVGVGVTQLAAAIFHRFLSRGETVLVPLPTYTAFFLAAELVRSAGRVVALPPNRGHRITAGQVRAGLQAHPRARALFLVNPVNPTGEVIPRTELEEIARLAIAHDLVVVSDEIYDRMVLDERRAFTSIASLTVDGHRMHDRTITLNGVSKCYGLAKLRVGFACAGRDLRRDLHLAGFVWMNTAAPDELAQRTVAAALTGTPPAYHAWVNALYRRNRDLVADRVDALNEQVNLLHGTRGVPYLRAPRPHSGFFAMIQALGLRGAFATDFDLTRHLAARGVGVLAGSVFGCRETDLWLRLTYATRRDELERGLDLLASAVLERVGELRADPPAVAAGAAE